MTDIPDFVYYRRVDINHDNVCQLLATYDYLCVEGVLELCCDFLKNSLDIETCIGIMCFAKFYFCTKLETDARRFVMRHYVQVSQQSEKLLELLVQELETILGSDELNVKHEEDLWIGILRWIDYDIENRKGHIVELMKNVRLGLLDAQFFHKRVKDHPYVAANET
jgi:kelch-like protein 10